MYAVALTSHACTMGVSVGITHFITKESKNPEPLQYVEVGNGRKFENPLHKKKGVNTRATDAIVFEIHPSIQP